MKHRILLLAPLTFVLFVQCSRVDTEYQAPKFKKEIHLNFEILSDEILYAPHTIVTCDGKLVVSGYYGSDGPTCYVYDKDGHFITSGVAHGRGPAETILGYQNIASSKDVITFYDIPLQQKLSFRINDFIAKGSSAISKESIDLPGWCSFFSDTPDNKQLRIISRSFLQNTDQPQRTIELLRDDGYSSTYEISPFEDRQVSYYASNQPYVAFSPDGTKMAISSSMGLILEVFSIEDGIELKKIKKFIEPKVSVNEYGYERKNDSVFGIEYIKGYKDGIYALFDGESTYGQAMNDRDRLLFPNIAVFDWTGEPQTLYSTDFRVMSICLLDKYIYAILKDIEGRCFLGRALY